MLRARAVVGRKARMGLTSASLIWNHGAIGAQRLRWCQNNYRRQMASFLEIV